MVDIALFERFLQLDAAERREFIRAAQGTVDESSVPQTVLTEIERRLVEMGQGAATEYVTLDQFRSEIADRRPRRTA